MNFKGLDEGLNSDLQLKHECLKHFRKYPLLNFGYTKYSLQIRNSFLLGAQLKMKYSSVYILKLNFKAMQTRNGNVL